MNELRLPYGPWKRVLAGEWSGNEVVYYESSDKYLLVAILDKKGERIEGMTLMMSKVFLSDKDPSNLVDSVEGNVLGIEKRTGAFKGNYIVLTSSPTYVSFDPDKLIDKTENLRNELQEKSKEIVSKSRKYNLELTELKRAGEEEKQRFLGEPLALPTLVIRKAQGKMMSRKKTDNIHLGKKEDGEKAEEKTESFRMTVITGKKEERKHASHLVLEGCVLNGVPGIVFNENEKYSRLENPNTDTSKFDRFDMKAEPIGLPVKKMKPGEDIFLEPQLLDKKVFSEIMGIRKDSKTAKVISKAMTRNAKEVKEVKLEDEEEETSEMIPTTIRKRPEDFKEVKKELEGIKEDKDKYYARRGKRIISLIQSEVPEISEGENEPEELVAPWLQKMGRTALIQLNDLDEGIKKGLVYCILKKLYLHFKKEGTKDFKVEVLFERFFGEKGIGKEITELIKKNQGLGVGTCISAESDMDIDKEILANKTMKISVRGGRKVNIKPSTKQPYQATLRPSLSSI